MVLTEVMMNVDTHQTFEILDILMACACLFEQIIDSSL